MRKFALVSILVCVGFGAFAQQEEEKTKPTDKGHYIVDGSVNFALNNSKLEFNGLESKSNAFIMNLSPKGAYFVMDRFAVGIEISFSYTDGEFTDPDGSKTSSNSTGVSAGPFLRYYLANGLFGEASVGFGTSKSTSGDYESRNDSFGYQVGVGYAIFLNQNISVEPMFSYRHTKFKNDELVTENTIGGFSLGAGFTIYL